MDKAKIIKGFDWYSNKVGVVVQIRTCNFPHLYLAKDDSTLCWRQIMKADIQIIEE